MTRNEIIRDLEERAVGEDCRYIALRCDVAREIVKLLRDVTNPRGGSCLTCIHEADTDSYCRKHQRCKVCGVCSGYEYKRSEDDD